MEKIEAKNLTDEQLSQELNSAELTYHELMYNHNVDGDKNAKNTQELKIARKNIARIKTEIRSRELTQLEKSGELGRDRIRERRRRVKKSKKNSK